MGALSTYLTQTQNLLGTGAAGNLYPTAQLTGYINTARNKVAREGQCVRVLPPISGPISAITVQSGGTGWGAVSVIVSAPDSPSGAQPFPGGQQAAATATTGGGGITSISISTAGQGYYAPVVSFSGAGSGATAIAIVSGANQTQVNQEIYPFAGANSLVAVSGSGISSIFMVNSVSVIWGTFRYTLMRLSFSKYQAFVRTYTAGYQYIPAAFAQFGQGQNGSLYTYPIPNASYQMEWDCCCIPNPLGTDSDPEPIPDPWQEVVPFYAAYYALMGAQRFADARLLWEEGEKFMHRARLNTNPRGVTNWYGRG